MATFRTADELLDRWKEGCGLPTLVGKAGNRCEVIDIWRSMSMFGYVCFHTEFGTIFFAGDERLEVIL
jgi:hypothetical protein